MHAGFLIGERVLSTPIYQDNDSRISQLPLNLSLGFLLACLLLSIGVLYCCVIRRVERTVECEDDTPVVNIYVLQIFETFNLLNLLL